MKLCDESFGTEWVLVWRLLPQPVWSFDGRRWVRTGTARGSLVKFTGFGDTFYVRPDEMLGWRRDVRNSQNATTLESSFKKFNGFRGPRYRVGLSRK